MKKGDIVVLNPSARMDIRSGVPTWKDEEMTERNENFDVFSSALVLQADKYATKVLYRQNICWVPTVSLKTIFEI